MLVRGRLILTSNGFMLDEVKSLLQKSLRRKERDLITKATKELIGYHKDQLPWKSLVTFLFEDHCLSDVEVLEEMVKSYHRKDKLYAVEILYSCYTCRIAACLPVISLDKEYHPKSYDFDIEVPKEYERLTERKNGHINTDILLANLAKAWNSKEEKHLISIFKLASMVEDIVKPDVTVKGKRFLIKDNVKKPCFAQVALSLLYKVTTDSYFKRYILKCFELSMIPEVCQRLILFSVLTQKIYKEKGLIKKVENIGYEKAKLCNISINKTQQKLTSMPSWAVDKHTYRGKTGYDSGRFLKKQKQKDGKDLTEQELEEFHAVRPKVGLEHFFTEGALCKKPMLDENPFWNRTKEIYFERPPKLQKTARMSAVFYEELLNTYPRFKSDGKKDDQASSKPNGKKRKLQETATASTSQETGFNDNEPVNKKPATVTKIKEKDEVVTFSELNLCGPLLQLPTGSAKLYTCLNMTMSQVVKIGYPPHKLAMTLFYHRVLKEVLDDPHTLSIKQEGNNLLFPLCKDPSFSEIKVTKHDFYDAISKKNVKDGEFVEKESLGIIQMHRFPVKKLSYAPMSFWAHYIYRGALNIGDSGLYNSITDSDMTFLFGIDMEECRNKVKSDDILDLMFVKRPAKTYAAAILEIIKKNRKELIEILKRDVDYYAIENIAKECGFMNFNKKMFGNRLKIAEKAISQL